MAAYDSTLVDAPPIHTRCQAIQTKLLTPASLMFRQPGIMLNPSDASWDLRNGRNCTLGPSHSMEENPYERR